MPPPNAGDALTVDDFDMLMEAIQKRRENFPDEPEKLSVGFVFFNIGDRFAPVKCSNGEWEGLKQDIPPTDPPGDIPKCPNGHVLLQGRGLCLGWVEDRT